MLATWHILHKFLHPICALLWVAVPDYGRRLPVEVGKPLVALFGIVYFIIDIDELLGAPCGDIDTVEMHVSTFDIQIDFSHS